MEPMEVDHSDDPQSSSPDASTPASATLPIIVYPPTANVAPINLIPASAVHTPRDVLAPPSPDQPSSQSTSNLASNPLLYDTNRLEIPAQSLPLPTFPSIVPAFRRSTAAGTSSAVDPALLPILPSSRQNADLLRDASAQTNTLLNSLSDLRSTLGTRVQVLSTEVERLRVRAEELEQGFMRDREGNQRTTERSLRNAVDGQMSRMARDAQEQIRLLRSTIINTPNPRPATTATPEAVGQLRRVGSGSVEIEGPRMWRRERRLAEYRSRPDTMCPTVSNNQQGAGQTHATTAMSTILQHLPPAQELANVPARLAQGIRRQFENHIAADVSTTARTGLSAPTVMEGLTSRGRRVQAAVQSNEADNQIEMPRALPTSASGMAITRYRDALISAGTSVLPPSSSFQNLTATPVVFDHTFPATNDGNRRAADADAVPAYPWLPSSDNGNGNQRDLRRSLAVGAERQLLTTSDISSRLAALEENMASRQLGRDELRLPSLRPPGLPGGPGTNRTPQAASSTINQLSTLAQTVAALSERVDAVRRLSRQTPSRGVGASTAPNIGAQRPSLTAPPEGQPQRPRFPQPRRPSYPPARGPQHPHHRPRMHEFPLAIVVNADNLSSFDVNLNADVIFRPVSVRVPDRELLARSLSMLPGGRLDGPSPWMRLSGTSNTRPRRAGATAGYWCRWICHGTPTATVPPRSLNWDNLPRITAFQFCLVPPESDSWLRADECEFYTRETVFSQQIGSWMHSRTRIEPFPTDPAVAEWGTSAHVRQTVSEYGGLRPGDYITFFLESHTTEIIRASTPASERARSEPGLSAVAPGPSNGAAAPTPNPSAPEGDWLRRFEPAVSQLRALWRAHYMRQDLGPPPPESEEHSEFEQDIPRLANPARYVQWSREWLDANGIPLRSSPRIDMENDSDEEGGDVSMIYI